MAWTDPRTWVAGEVPNAATFNTHVRDNFRMLWRLLLETEFTGDVTYNNTGVEVVTSGAFTYSAYPTLIEFFAPGWISAASTVLHRLELNDGVTRLGILAQHQITTTYPFIRVTRKVTPSAGSHTYRILAFGDAGSNIKAGAGGVGVLERGFIRIWQRGQ